MESASGDTDAFWGAPPLSRKDLPARKLLFGARNEDVESVKRQSCEICFNASP